jgi:E3 ubiquitin-protein ligase UHRF1
MPTDYERQRAERVAQNTKMLQDLMGTHKENVSTVKKTAKKTETRTAGRKSVPNKPAKVPKKRAQVSSDDRESGTPKRMRLESPQLGLRRSSRNAGKTQPDYQGELQTRLPRLVTTKVGVDHDREPNQRSGKRIHDPYVGCLLIVSQIYADTIHDYSKTFGHIPGIPVGTWWETR